MSKIQNVVSVGPESFEAGREYTFLYQGKKDATPRLRRVIPTPHEKYGVIVRVAQSTGHWNLFAEDLEDSNTPKTFDLSNFHSHPVEVVEDEVEELDFPFMGDEDYEPSDEGYDPYMGAAEAEADAYMSQWD